MAGCFCVCCGWDWNIFTWSRESFDSSNWWWTRFMWRNHAALPRSDCRITCSRSLSLSPNMTISRFNCIWFFNFHNDTLCCCIHCWIARLKLENYQLLLYITTANFQAAIEQICLNRYCCLPTSDWSSLTDDEKAGKLESGWKISEWSDSKAGKTLFFSQFPLIELKKAALNWQFFSLLPLTTRAVELFL